MKLRLIQKRPEVGEVVSFLFEPLEPLTWRSGQYINITMPDVMPVDQDRLFTIASAPYENELLITTYIGSSSYKQRMTQLPVGTVIEADQLGGDFVWQDDGREKLFVAGGIGITTFRSIILDRIHNNLPNNALLLYAGKAERRPFMPTLEDSVASDATLSMHIYDETRLTLDRLLHDVTDVFERTVYRAGSQTFSETLGEGLVKTGIDRRQIKYDYFDGYVDIEY